MRCIEIFRETGPPFLASSGVRTLDLAKAEEDWTVCIGPYILTIQKIVDETVSCREPNRKRYRRGDLERIRPNAEIQKQGRFRQNGFVAIFTKSTSFDGKSSLGHYQKASVTRATLESLRIAKRANGCFGIAAVRSDRRFNMASVFATGLMPRAKHFFPTNCGPLLHPFFQSGYSGPSKHSPYPKGGRPRIGDRAFVYSQDGNRLGVFAALALGAVVGPACVAL